MKKLIIPLLISGLVIYLYMSRESKSKKPESNSAAQYNDHLVQLQAGVARKMNTLMASFKSRNSYEMNTHLQELQREARHAVEAIGDIPDFMGNTEFRDSMLELMEYIEGICNNEFLTMVGILSDPDGYASEAEEEQLKDFENTLNTEGMRLQKQANQAQQAFARKFNLKIQPNPIF